MDPVEKLNWHGKLAKMIPSYGRDIQKEKGLYEKIIKRANDVLLFGASAPQLPGDRSSRRKGCNRMAQRAAPWGPCHSCPNLQQASGSSLHARGSGHKSSKSILERTYNKIHIGPDGNLTVRLADFQLLCVLLRDWGTTPAAEVCFLGEPYGDTFSVLLLPRSLCTAVSQGRLRARRSRRCGPS